MGTNYYAYNTGIKTTCSCCGHESTMERVHIGKSSVGWVFSLHILPKNGINTLADWLVVLTEIGVTIKDEYDREMSLNEFLPYIVERSGKPIDKSLYSEPAYGYYSWEEFLKRNHAEEGPNNLLRSKVDDFHCVGHGEGTWDYIIGDFN